MENSTSIDSGFSYKNWLQMANPKAPVTDKEVGSFFQNLTTSFNILMQQDTAAAKRESDEFKQIYNDANG